MIYVKVRAGQGTRSDYVAYKWQKMPLEKPERGARQPKQPERLCGCETPLVLEDFSCLKCGHVADWRYYGTCPDCGGTDGPLRGGKTPRVQANVLPGPVRLQPDPRTAQNLPWFHCRRHKLRWTSWPVEWREDADRRNRALLEKYRDVAEPSPAVPKLRPVTLPKPKKARRKLPGQLPLTTKVAA